MRKSSILAALGVLAIVHAPESQGANVVASIKPIHSLVAGVMGEAGEPRLMITGVASPHTYQMRPSEAAELNDADLIVWVGEGLETFLERPIANLGAGAEVVTLHKAAGMELLPNREGGIWPDEHDAHGHDEHAHGHDEHADDHGEHADEHDEHADEHGEHEEVHVDEHDAHGHHHAEFDMHVWLDPGNAGRIVEVVADALTRIDPERSETWRGNAEAMRTRIDALESSLGAQLAPVRQRAFIVFHDGYQYFERAFGLNGKGAIAVDPARPPSAKRLAELRAALDEHDVRCVFTEPQFEPDLVRTVVEGSAVRTGALDPLGVDVEPGPDAWFAMMRDLGDSFAQCLGDN